jgi:hypothetical protein
LREDTVDNVETPVKLGGSFANEVLKTGKLLLHGVDIFNNIILSRPGGDDVL